MNSWVYIFIFESFCLSFLNAESSSYLPVSGSYFQVTVNGSTQFSVRWNSSYPSNTTRQFRITVNDDFDQNCKEFVRTGTFVCEIANKIPNTKYFCQLWTCPVNTEDKTTCKAESNRTQVHTLPQVPNTFDAKALDNESIEVTWEIPDQNVNGLKTVVLLAGEEIPHRFAQNTKAGKGNTTFEKLRPLTAYNAKFIIQRADPIFESVLDKENIFTFPNAPTNITVKAVGTSWITAVLVPAHAGTDIYLKHTIAADASSGEHKDCQATSISEGIGCKIDKLLPNTTYTLTATTCHNADCSVPSPPLVQTTEPEVPGGLSAGAIVGIVLGSVLGCLLLAVIIFFIVLQHKSTHGPIEIPGMTAI